MRVSPPGYYYTALNGCQWILKDDDVTKELASIRAVLEDERKRCAIIDPETAPCQKCADRTAAAKGGGDSMVIMKCDCGAKIERMENDYAELHKKAARLERVACDLEKQNERLERQASEAYADRDRWILVARERLDTIAEANDSTKSMKRLFMEPVYKQRIAELNRAVDEMPGWIAAIKAERMRQDAKWGEQNHNDFKWLSILVEEVGELAKAILENDPKGVEELTHCAAVCVQWMDAIHRRGKRA